MDFDKFAKTLLNDPKSMTNLNARFEETNRANKELAILNNLIYNKNFISMGNGGLVKVISKGTKMVEQIIIDDALLTDKQALAISIQNCVNKNLMDIDRELKEAQEQILERFPFMKELSGQL